MCAWGDGDGRGHGMNRGGVRRGFSWVEVSRSRCESSGGSSRRGETGVWTGVTICGLGVSIR